MSTNEKKTVLLLFGGMSSEHEVSCMSAASVLEHIDREKYNLVVIGITKEGKWMETDASPERIRTGNWIDKLEERETFISPLRRVHGIHRTDGKERRIDCVFSVLHGKYGEDGSMQGLLELAGIPYVGSGVLSMAVTMDKAVTKVLAHEAGVMQADYIVVDFFTFATAAGEVIRSIEDKFDGVYPLFVKPANTGSSVGVTMVHDQRELFEGIKIAGEYDRKIIVEEAIEGREIEVAVLGNRTPHASPLGEIQSAGEFYDYKAKYGEIGSIAEVAEGIPEYLMDKVKETAITVYKALGCRGLGRVDFFLRGTEIIFNEINTLPGFTKISMYPKLWQSADVSYTELIDRLINLAIEEKEESL